MKKRLTSPRILLGLLLILLSILFYVIHYLLFRDSHHIFIYLVGDIAFVFIEVLLVTLIIHQILSDREKRAIFKKLNMVIGAFYSEVGTPLLKYFQVFDVNADQTSNHLIVSNDWSPEHFVLIKKVLQNHSYKINSQTGDLEGLRNFLVDKRAFLLRLLENPNLLEHENFTDLLWAVFHLAEELSHRTNVKDLPDTDYQHLAGDIARAYKLLIKQWIEHMEHLKNDYPYLFSLAIRTNPFNPEASPEVK